MAAAFLLLLESGISCGSTRSTMLAMLGGCGWIGNCCHSIDVFSGRGRDLGLRLGIWGDGKTRLPKYPNENPTTLTLINVLLLGLG